MLCANPSVRVACNFLYPLLRSRWFAFWICRFILFLVLLGSGCQAITGQTSLADSSSDHWKINPRQAAEIDRIVLQQIERGNMAGCVVAIGDRSGIAFIKAFGHRQLEPTRETMTVDTLFDLASLTKPIATATSIMKLAEQGKLTIDDSASLHWPEFGKNGKEKITIRHLLTHQAGLIPDNPIGDYDHGIEVAHQKICGLAPVSEPGSKFSYTDVGFIVLGEIVHRISGMNLDEYSRSKIFIPIQMHETRFLPGASLQKRAATTERVDNRWLKGRVHDPRASRLGGIAGHAGLFSTATDLARFARMLLGQGTLEGGQVLRPATVEKMGARRKVSSGFRTLGWDSLSGYSSNRGDLFSSSAFGHGGFTGTSFWVDPNLDLFVVFLSNRLHPDGKGTVNSLAGRVGTIAAASRLASKQSTRTPPAPQRSPVMTGIDILVQDRFKSLEGLRVGLITNQTGIARTGKRTSALFHESSNVNLVALFSPEHGIDGDLDIATILDSNDGATGIEIHSLYGTRRSPSPEQLAELDVLVFDIQDIGTRFYTYVSTMGLAMQVAEEQGIKFVVLDRPNPINGENVQGPGIDASETSFIAFHDIPVRHGMTVGELAQMFQAELKLDDLDLEIVKMEGWRRTDYFDQTGLRWVNPSPNMRNLNQAVLYPGIGLLEMTNLSVGRGTDTPFEVIGAPWINELEFAAAMNQRQLPGVRFVPISFVPKTSKFENETCHGINIIVTDREEFSPILTGLHIANCLARQYPLAWKSKAYGTLLKNEKVYREIVTPNQTDADRLRRHAAENQKFKRRREEFLLYGID